MKELFRSANLFLLRRPLPVAGGVVVLLTWFALASQVPTLFVVGSGLVGDYVGHAPAADHFGVDGGGVAQQADGEGAALLDGLVGEREGVVQVVGGSIEVGGLQAALDARWVHLHDDGDAAVHGHGEGLRAAHAPKPSREHQAAREVGA